MVMRQEVRAAEIPGGIGQLVVHGPGHEEVGAQSPRLGLHDVGGAHGLREGQSTHAVLVADDPDAHFAAVAANPKLQGLASSYFERAVDGARRLEDRVP